MEEKIKQFKEMIEQLQSKIAERSKEIEDLQVANQIDLLNVYNYYNMIELAREMESVS